MGTDKEFPEWMMTKALANYLETKASTPTYAQRVAWLFGLKAQTYGGAQMTIHELCGFSSEEADAAGGPEKSLVSRDMGTIPADDLKLFLSTFADFGYWTPKRDRQLILEAKGTTKPIGERDHIQAKRYFEYLRKYPRKGALVYLVPEPTGWLTWLNEQAREAGLGQDDGKTWGVVGWEPQIIPQIAGRLVGVISQELAKMAALMDRASGSLIRNEL